MRDYPDVPDCPDWICMCDDTCGYKCDDCLVNKDRGCCNCGLFYSCYPKE